MTLDPKVREIITEGVAQREALIEQDGLRGLIRVEIEPVDTLTYHARPTAESEFTLVVDEPVDRGGGNKGPSPLVYFLTGIGACLLSQFVRVGIARGVDLSYKEMRLKGERDRRVGGGFQHITQEIYAEGPASEDEVRALSEEAEAFCYVHVTLRRAVKMTLVVHLNGNEVVRRVSEPPALA